MKLFYRQIGSGEPILVLHGLFGSSDNWMTIANGLKEIGQIYLVDMRNHGRSPHSTVLDYTAMTEDIYEFLADLSLRQVSIIGHSMGGLTAMNFTLIYPHRVKKLVVIDIAPRIYPIHHQNIVDGLLAVNIAKIKTRQQADEQLAGHIEQASTRQFLLKNLYRSTDGKYSWRLNLPVIAQNLVNMGAGLTTAALEQPPFQEPCLFIRSALSDYIQEEDKLHIKKLFPVAEIITVENTTHWLPAEDPETVLSILKTFINQNKSLH